MSSSNPVLSDKAFQSVYGRGEEVMTTDGAYMKTAILLGICICAASFTFNTAGMALMWPGVIGGFVLALVTVFKKEWSPVTAPLYAVFEGAALGGISFMYQAMYAGIVLNAVMLTICVFSVMLFLFRTKMIEVTAKLRTGIVAATGGIMLVYLATMGLGFFGISIPYIHGSGPIGIGFSLFVTGLAAFNLLLDFDFIEKASATGATPKYMEWYAGFGLLVTLIWLYLELLRLLSKLNSRR